MTEKRRLGKGLGALIPEVVAEDPSVNEIALEKIKPNPYQPRRDFNHEKLQQLAESIKEHGILQAVVLSPDGEEYVLIAGERRCRAARMAGLTTVPAIIRDVSSQQMLEIALIENLQRDDLNPVEEARAYKRLLKEFEYTQDELAVRVSKSRSAVANSLRLLTLPENVLKCLEEGRLTPGQARPMITLNGREVQGELLQKILKHALPARVVEREALRLASEGVEGQSKKPVEVKADPLLVELQNQIQKQLGTKVSISRGSKGGKIEIFYYGEEDLERLISKLLPKGIE